MHKVLVYNKNYDEAFFVTKFVKGLKHEIQTAICLHKPRIVDAALSLAQTQEDLLEEGRQSSTAHYKTECKYSSKYDYKTPISSKGILGAAPEDKNGTDDKTKLKQKLEALKAMHKAKGLCFKCGDK